MHFKRPLGIIAVSALVAASFGSCDSAPFEAFTDTEIDAIEETLNDYLDAVTQADYDAAKDYVEDEAECFLTAEFDDQSAELIAAILNETEYDIDEIEHDEDSAAAQVTFTVPDIESIADEGYDFDEFVEAVGELEDMVEVSFEYELSKDDDTWLIDADSTEDLCDYLTQLIADLEFGRLTEENALETVDTFITLMSEGDITGANNLLTPNDNVFVSYIAMATLIPGLPDVLASYSSSLTYTSEVTEVTDEYIIVDVTGTAPDLQAAIDAVIDNEDIMVPLYADYIEATLNGQDENLLFFSMAGSLMTSVGESLDAAPTAPVTFSFKVTENEDGELRLELTGGPEFSIDMDDLSSRTEYIVPAITQLLSEGRISFDQVLELQQMYGV